MEIDLSSYDPLRLPKVVCNIILKLLKLIPFLIRFSIPYFCTEIINGIIMQKVFYLVSVRLRQFPLDVFLPSWIHFSTITLVKFNLLFMLQFHLPVFLAAITTVSLISVMAAEEGSRVLKLKELPRRLLAISKWKNSFIRFTCLSVISLASYLILQNWLASGLIVVASLKVYYVVMYVLGFIAVLVKWMEFDAVWNLGAAIANEDHGLKPWKVSMYIGEGSKLFASFVLVLYFCWCLSTSVSRFFVKDALTEVAYSGIIDAVLYVGLILGKVI